MKAAGCVDYDSLEAELCYVGRRRYESNDFTALAYRTTRLLPAMADPDHRS